MDQLGMTPIPSQILILEPEPLQRDLIRLAINRLGFPMAVHSDTRSAEDALRKELPLVAIIDLFLPQESGVDWLNRMKQIPGFTTVPVLVLSSLGYPDMVHQAAQAGARAFLTKPVDTDLLIERVIRLIARGDDLPL
jgi:two-component system, chemotaxis family, chemotaxis protein CheY